MTLILCCGIASAGSKAFIINSGAKEPLASKSGDGFYNLITEELFRRLGEDAKVVLLPSERALVNANKGIDDGNIARVPGIEKKYTNLVRVPEPVLEFEFMAYSNSHESPSISGWNSFSPYVVGYMTGWKIYEKNIKITRKTTKVKNPTQLFKLLKNKRADVVMFDRWMGLYWLNKLNIKANLVEPPVAKKKMYIYMNKKYSGLVPKIDMALKQMKQDGTYDQIKRKSLLKLQEQYLKTSAKR